MSEAEDVHMRDETGMEEDEIEDSSGIEEEDAGEGGDSLQKAKQAITCRNVTLNTLMDDGIIEAGNSLLSIDYLGQRFEADLLPNGKIKWHGSEDEFGTPSAWALHCKRLVNPVKRSGCGWASVKYKNKKLDMWKSIWARKHRTTSPFKSQHPSPGQSGSQSQFSPPQPAPSAAALSMNLSSPCADGEKILTSTPVKNVPTTAKPDVVDTTPISTKVLSLSPVSLTISASSSSSLTMATAATTTTITAAATNSEESTIATAVQSTPEVTKDDGRGGDIGNMTGTGSDGDPKSVVSERNTSSAQSPQKAGMNDVSPNSMQPPPENLSITATPKRSDITSPWPKENHRGTGDVVLKERKSISYSSLGMRTTDVDLNTLVKCEHFDSHNKLQPFTVSLTTNAALLMDFHCHLTRSEVVGYLGGRWDPQRQHLSIEQSFPVLCRLGDKFKAPLVEDEIRRRIKTRKMTLVGWYHSHPYCTAQPSIRDIDCQMSYQLKMRGGGSTYHPCIGFIEAPYEKTDDKTDPFLQGFWVMPNLEHPSSYNIPMHISYSLQRDLSLTEDILIDMRRLTEFYSGSADRVRFKERWKDSVTYLDKIRTCLASKLPEDQLSSGTFLDYMQQLVKEMK